MGNRTDFCIDLFAFTIRPPAWETAPISVSICSPSQFAHLHGKPHRRPFRLKGTHVISIPFVVAIHNSMLAFMGARTDTLQLGQISCSLLYLLLSIGSLEQFWNVITLELRASFFGRRSSFPSFFKCLFGFAWFVLSYNKYPPTSAPPLYMTPIYNSTFTTVQYRTFTDPLL